MEVCTTMNKAAAVEAVNLKLLGNAAQGAAGEPEGDSNSHVRNISVTEMNDLMAQGAPVSFVIVGDGEDTLDWIQQTIVVGNNQNEGENQSLVTVVEKTEDGGKKDNGNGTLQVCEISSNHSLGGAEKRKRSESPTNHVLPKVIKLSSGQALNQRTVDVKTERVVSSQMQEALISNTNSDNVDVKNAATDSVHSLQGSDKAMAAQAGRGSREFSPVITIYASSPSSTFPPLSGSSSIAPADSLQVQHHAMATVATGSSNLSAASGQDGSTPLHQPITIKTEPGPFKTVQSPSQPSVNSCSIAEALPIKISSPGANVELRTNGDVGYNSTDSGNSSSTKSQHRDGEWGAPSRRARPDSEICSMVYRCGECDYASGNKHYYKQHVDLVHSSARPFKCPFCDYAGKRGHALREHLVVHSAQRPYSCRHCNATFRKKGHLTHHTKLHAAPAITTVAITLPEGPTVQVETGAPDVEGKVMGVSVGEAANGSLKAAPMMTSSGRMTLLSAEKKGHGQALSASLVKRGDFWCALCDKDMANAAAFQDHLQAVHDTDHLYACQTCDYVTARKAAIMDHLSTHITQLPPPPPPSPADHAASTSATPQPPPPTKAKVAPAASHTLFACTQCGFSTPAMSTLVTHAASHVASQAKAAGQTAASLQANNKSPRPHQSPMSKVMCSECGHIADNPDMMRAHMWIHIKPSGVEPGDKHCAPEPLKQQKGGADGVGVTPPGASPAGLKSLPENAAFKCTECSYVSREASQFVKHMLVHKTQHNQAPKPQIQAGTMEPAGSNVLSIAGNPRTAAVAAAGSYRVKPVTTENTCRNTESSPFVHDASTGRFRCTICGYTCEYQRTIKAHIWKHSGHRKVDYPIFQNGPLSMYEDPAPPASSNQPLGQNLAGHPTGHPVSHSAGHPAGHPTGHPVSHPAGHPTGHPVSHPAGHPTGHPVSHPAGHPTGHPISHPAGHPTGHPAGHPASHTASRLVTSLSSQSHLQRSNVLLDTAPPAKPAVPDTDATGTNAGHQAKDSGPTNRVAVSGQVSAGKDAAGQGSGVGGGVSVKFITVSGSKVLHASGPLPTTGHIKLVPIETKACDSAKLPLSLQSGNIKLDIVPKEVCEAAKLSHITEAGNPSLPTGNIQLVPINAKETLSSSDAVKILSSNIAKPVLTSDTVTAPQLSEDSSAVKSTFDTLTPPRLSDAINTSLVSRPRQPCNVADRQLVAEVMAAGASLSSEAGKTLVKTEKGEASALPGSTALSGNTPPLGSVTASEVQHLSAAGTEATACTDISALPGNVDVKGVEKPCLTSQCGGKTSRKPVYSVLNATNMTALALSTPRHSATASHAGEVGRTKGSMQLNVSSSSSSSTSSSSPLAVSVNPLLPAASTDPYPEDAASLVPLCFAALGLESTAYVGHQVKPSGSDRLADPQDSPVVSKSAVEQDKPQEEMWRVVGIQTKTISPHPGLASKSENNRSESSSRGHPSDRGLPKNNSARDETVEALVSNIKDHGGSAALGNRSESATTTSLAVRIASRVYEIRNEEEIQEKYSSVDLSIRDKEIGKQKEKMRGMIPDSVSMEASLSNQTGDTTGELRAVEPSVAMETAQLTIKAEPGAVSEPSIVVGIAKQPITAAVEPGVVIDTSKQLVIAAVEPGVVMETIKQPVTATVEPGVVMETSKQSVIAAVEPGIVMETNKQPVTAAAETDIVMETSKQPVTVAVEPGVVMETSKQPVTVAVEPGVVMETSKQSVTAAVETGVVMETRKQPVTAAVETGAVSEPSVVVEAVAGLPSHSSLTGLRSQQGSPRVPRSWNSSPVIPDSLQGQPVDSTAGSGSADPTSRVVETRSKAMETRSQTMDNTNRTEALETGAKPAVETSGKRTLRWSLRNVERNKRKEENAEGEGGSVSPRAVHPQSKRTLCQTSLPLAEETVTSMVRMQENDDDDHLLSTQCSQDSDSAVTLLSLLKRGPNLNPACPPPPAVSSRDDAASAEEMSEENSPGRSPSLSSETDSVNKEFLSEEMDSSSSAAQTRGAGGGGICSTLLAVIEQLRERSRSESDAEDKLSQPPAKKQRTVRRRGRQDGGEEETLAEHDSDNIERLSGGSEGGAYRCKLCHYTSPRVPLIRLHMRTHRQKDPFECSLCPMKAESSEMLQEHMIRHCKVRTYACKFCPQSFNHKSTLRAHMRAHNDTDPFLCDLCEFESPSPLEYRAHMQKHVGSTVKRPGSVLLRCPHCGAVAGSHRQLSVHLASVCPSAPHRPQDGGGSSDNSATCSQQQRPHNDGGVGSGSEKTLMCPQCSFTTSDKPAMDSHLSLHDAEGSGGSVGVGLGVGEGSGPLRCALCDFLALSPRSLKSHMKRHANDQRYVQQPLEQYKCSLCGYVCHHLPSLKSHMWRHAPDRNYSYHYTNDVINAAIDYDTHSESTTPTTAPTTTTVTTAAPTPLAAITTTTGGLNNTDVVAVVTSGVSNEVVDTVSTGRSRMMEGGAGAGGGYKPGCVVTFRCCQCGFETINKAQLNLHMRSHADIIHRTLKVNPGMASEEGGGGGGGEGAPMATDIVDADGRRVQIVYGPV